MMKELPVARHASISNRSGEGCDLLHSLARYATRVRTPTEIDRFVAYAQSVGGISDADWYGVEADGFEEGRRFCPEGGLTEEHYLRLGRDKREKVLLARAVLNNLLRLRGHDSWSRMRAFHLLNDGNLPALVDEHSFEVVADAIEPLAEDAASEERQAEHRYEPDDLREAVSARAAGPGPGRLVQPTEKVAWNIRERGEPAPEREHGTLAEVLRRLDALEEVSRQSPTPTMAWESMAQGITRIADALEPPLPDIVDTTYVARRLGCTTTWIADQARSGDIPRRCIVSGTGKGKPWKFYREAINEWIASR